MKNLLTLFFQGLLYLVPISVTIYVLYMVVNFADSLFETLVPNVHMVTGTGLVLTVALVTLTGYVGGRVLSTPFANIFHNAIRRMPFVSLIYTSVRDLMKAFVGEKKKFDKPVLVCLDREGINHRLGFITQSSLDKIGLGEFVAVYCPYPYSVMGDLVVVPADKVKVLDGVNSVELMKMVVSGGVVNTDEEEGANVPKENGRGDV